MSASRSTPSAIRHLRRGDLVERQADAGIPCDKHKVAPPTRRDSFGHPAIGAAWIAADRACDGAVAPKGFDDLAGCHVADGITISAMRQAQFRLPTDAARAGHNQRMPISADQSDDGTKIKVDQKRRLRILRLTLEPTQAHAAIRAGVSSVSWNRMEVGDTEVSPIALARFCQSYGIAGAGWVISGELAGLPSRLAADFSREFPELIAGATERNGEPPSLLPGGKIGPNHILRTRMAHDRDE
jgi:hypothetical protein